MMCYYLNVQFQGQKVNRVKYLKCLLLAVTERSGQGFQFASYFRLNLTSFNNAV